MWPADGMLGKKFLYDPVEDAKLDKKARASLKPQYKDILDKVRDGYT